MPTTITRASKRSTAKQPAAAEEIVHVTRFDTALGAVSLASTEKGVVAMSLPGQPAATTTRWIAKRLPGAKVEQGTGRNRAAVTAVQQFLTGKRRELDLPLDLRGTPFQKKVWSALLAIPYGETISYKQLASRTGNAAASRACGAANGANPVPLIVPCHRVVAADGTLGGYGGGLPLKRKLLELESR